MGTLATGECVTMRGAHHTLVTWTAGAWVTVVMTGFPITLHPIRTQAAHISRALAHPHIDTLDSLVAGVAGTRVNCCCALDTIALKPSGTVATLGLVVVIVASDAGEARVVFRAVINDTTVTVS